MINLVLFLRKVKNILFNYTTFKIMIFLYFNCYTHLPNINSYSQFTRKYIEFHMALPSILSKLYVLIYKY